MEINYFAREQLDYRWMGSGLPKVPISISHIAASLLISSDFVHRHLDLCIHDICGVIPSPNKSFKPWHIGRLVDVLMYIQARRQGASSTHKDFHGYYPSFRTLVPSAKHSSRISTSQTMDDESLRRWALLRAQWDLLGRLFVWEDARAKPIGEGSVVLSTTQINDSALVIDWKNTAFPLAIASWVKHSLSYSVRRISVGLNLLASKQILPDLLPSCQRRQLQVQGHVQAVQCVL
jgi:hypothetical protein